MKPRFILTYNFESIQINEGKTNKVTMKNSKLLYILPQQSPNFSKN
jgi:hypothetical protein